MQTTIWMMAAEMAVFCSGSVTAGPVQDLPVQTETENGGDGDAVLEGSLSAADQIAKSIVSENGGILFEIPEGTVQPETLKIHISGRVEYEWFQRQRPLSGRGKRELEGRHDLFHSL